MLEDCTEDLVMYKTKCFNYICGKSGVESELNVDHDLFQLFGQYSFESFFNFHFNYKEVLF